MLTAIAKAFGYVPAADLAAIEVAHQKCEKDTADLKRRVHDLEFVNVVRARLENEIKHLRAVELARINAAPAIDKSIGVLDDVVVRLEELMRTWPAGEFAAAAA